jgi:small subunit ribosomal protein S11
MIYRKKIENFVNFGVVNIQAAENNTIISVSDKNGNVLCWSSGGVLGYYGGKKATSLAAQSAAYDVGLKAKFYQMKKLLIIIKGHGDGRDDAIYIFQELGFLITSVIERIKLPHNGCRPPKKRYL